MITVAQQLAEEIAARLGVVALLDPAVARAALADGAIVAPGWAASLADPAHRERLAPDVYEALWPFPPPPEWWGTPLGRCLIEGGVRPSGCVSVADAALVLGCSERTARRRLGAGKHDLTAVIDLLHSVDSSEGPADP